MCRIGRAIEPSTAAALCALMTRSGGLSVAPYVGIRGTQAVTMIAKVSALFLACLLRASVTPLRAHTGRAAGIWVPSADANHGRAKVAWLSARVTAVAAYGPARVPRWRARPGRLSKVY